MKAPDDGKLAREDLLALLLAGPDGEAIRPLVEGALKALGWEAKQRFRREEVLQLTETLAAGVASGLAASEDPDMRDMGTGLQQLLAEA